MHRLQRSIVCIYVIENKMLDAMWLDERKCQENCAGEKRTRKI